MEERSAAAESSAELFGPQTKHAAQHYKPAGGSAMLRSCRGGKRLKGNALKYRENLTLGWVGGWGG